MSETAKTLKINRTTLLRLLHTLEVEGFVERRPNGAGFQVGLDVPGIGRARAVLAGSGAGGGPGADQAGRDAAAFGPSRRARRHRRALSRAPHARTRRSPATSASAAGCRRMPPPWAACCSPSCRRSRSRRSMPARQLAALQRAHRDHARGAAGQGRAGPARRHRLERSAISSAASARPRCRCSISPACRSARSTCPARSVRSPSEAATRA